MTRLANDPALWDTVFSDLKEKVRFVKRIAQGPSCSIVDVGCATGTISSALRREGFDVAGVDINEKFIRAARYKDPSIVYRVGDMKSFRIRKKFNLLICLGTTFSYNLDHTAIEATLRNFQRHLLPGGRVVIDVVNAMAFVGPRPFKPKTYHRFKHKGVRMEARIRHKLDLQNQIMTEQVTWRDGGQAAKRDRADRIRLFFPQELSFYLKAAGFNHVRLVDSYTRSSKTFSGRRLIAIGTRARIERSNESHGGDAT